MKKYVFSVKNGKTRLNGEEIQVKGLRCSNALYSEESTAELVANLGLFASYGVNTVSVYFMGNRFGDIKGYNSDASLNSVYSDRMCKIIEAAGDLGMLVLVGCLYWDVSKSKWENWTQKEANLAVENTVRWLGEKDYRNVFIDVDNEGMARGKSGFDVGEMIAAGKSVDPGYIFASNYKGLPPAEADIAIHFSYKAEGKPYIESEGVPENADGMYWFHYSKILDDNFDSDAQEKHTRYYNYINVGVYTEAMKDNQIQITKDHLDNGYGYMLASTWLQAVPPKGPNHRPGGYGSESDPGIRWWLEFLREKYGSYTPPVPLLTKPGDSGVKPV